MQKRNLLHIVGVLLLGLLLVALFSCTQSPSSTQAPSPAPTPAVAPSPAPKPSPASAPTTAPAPGPSTTTENLLLGIVVPLSGSGASWGIPFKRGAELAVDKINEAGGVKIGNKRYIIKTDSYDDKYAPEGGVAGVNKMMGMGSKYILGMGTTTTLAQQPITNENKIILGHSAFSVKALGPSLPYNFRFNMPSWETALGLYSWYTKKHPEVKSFSFMALDNATGHDTGEVIVKVLTQDFGLTRVSEDYFAPETTDFYPLLTKVLAKKPGVISTDSLTSPTVAILAKQARELGFKGNFIGETTLVPQMMIGIAGKAADGIISTGYDYGVYPARTPAEAEFVSRYVPKWGNEYLNINAVVTYQWVLILRDAMEKAQSIDTTAVKNALETIPNFDTVSGKAFFGGKEHYGVDHQLLHTMLAVEIVDGKQTVQAEINPPFGKK